MPAGRFARDLLGWYAVAQRDLPWRRDHAPYRVLVSEIMLQQTQVTRVVPLYHAFLERFPDVAALAAASPADVLDAWRGLGYNRRALALHRAAQAVVAQHGGVIPDTREALEALPGVGPYTARAVLAFAFGHDAAPVDTNIARILARAVEGAPLSGVHVRSVAEQVVPRGRGRDWSAALMDLGATVCVSRRPRCEACPVRASCVWQATGGEDPAHLARSAAPAPFLGSNRYHRGRLVDALRTGPVHRDAVPAAAESDGHRAHDLVAGLVRDGLAQWDGDHLRLPR